MYDRISLVRTGGRIPIRFKKSTRSSSALAFRVIFTYLERYQILHLQAKYSSISEMIFNIINRFSKELFHWNFKWTYKCKTKKTVDFGLTFPIVAKLNFLKNSRCRLI